MGRGVRPPMEYLEYMLIKNVYHCTPSQLDDQSNDIIDLHLNFFNIENKKKADDFKKQQLKYKR